MKSPEKKSLNTIIQFSGLAIQMGVVIYLGAELGEYLDGKYPNEKGWFKIGGVFLAVSLSMVSLIVRANKLNK